MVFGVVSHKQISPNAACLGSTEDDKGHGSMNLKHQRSGLSEDSNWRLPKMLRPGEVDFSSSKATESFAAFGRSNLWPSSAVDDGQKMLSFSSAVPHGGGGGGSSKSIAFSSCHDEHHSRGGGGSLNGGLRGPFARMRGPFTPSQWMELEHQALIYKHLVANVPIPSNLLIPLKRSLYSYGSPQSYASNFLGWGPFHLGFSGSNDPEPGRCRRTDGKKWRCSRDAVPDQKYCERHINRGRHRSRKPVEAQSGHAIAVSGIGSTTNTTSKVVPPIASSSSSSASVMSSNSLGALRHQFNNTASTSTDHLVNRSQVYQGLSLITPIQKQHVPFEESSHSEFGIVTSDSLLNPTERISYINTNNNQNPIHHFIDDWPKDHSELKSDWTQLSMSIPVAAPDFQSPSSSSPAQEKSSISALRLSHELDPIHMGLGVSHHHDLGELNPKQQSQSSSSSWLPVNWGNSMGGPLGEVLSSHQVGSSPTGVLQRSTFVSLSNSSSGSSPRSMDNKNKVSENGGFCNDLLGSAAAAAARVTSAAIPSL